MSTLELEKGGTALVLEMSGERVVLLAPIAAPPGSSLEATFCGSRIVVKVKGSRRVEPDAAGRQCRVEGRFVGLTRAQRGALGGK
jgi:hypothetical protein